MIDCGEGTQLQFRKCGLSFTKLRAIFITHIHGDHCFGLPGLLSTLSLLGRRQALPVYAPEIVAKAMQQVIGTLCGDLPYEVQFNAFDAEAVETIYEDKTFAVSTLPLKHRTPSSGFLFKEKQGLLHLDRAACDFHRVPVSYFDRIKHGCDYVGGDGKVIPNHLLTRPADPPRSFAYCSDTAYNPSLAGLVHGVDLLYHEATFAESDAKRANETFHSTSRQAAQVAKDANVKKLLIGHYSARYKALDLLLNEAKSVFPDTILAHEMLKLKL